jgi:trimeric autotransporter adhesin
MKKHWIVVSMYSIAFSAIAQSPDLSFWDTNGAVRCFATKGDTLFVGGDFTHVGPFTGGLLPVEATTGASTPSFGIIDGDVNVVISDGVGGWYVGGSARIDTMNWCNLPVAFVRHILPDRSVDPSVQVDGALYTEVTDLALWNDQLLIAGRVDTLNGVPFENLVRMDTATATLSAFPNNPNGIIQDLEVVGDVLYMAGNFNLLGNQTRTSLAAIDLTDGSVHPWQPEVEGAAHCFVASGNVMHIAGEFVASGGMESMFMLTADLTFGGTAIHPIQPNNAVHALAIAGDTLLLGGDFTELSGEVRQHLGAMHLPTLSLLPLSLDIGNGNGARVSAIHVSPDRIHFGGNFNSVGGTPRHHVAAIERSDGTLSAWAPILGGYANALAGVGEEVLIGGRFHIANGEQRNGLCCFRMSTGQLLPWSPVLENSGGPSSYQRVGDMDIAGNTLYVGGSFASAEGLPRWGAAAYDVSTGVLTEWDPNVDGAYVKALKVHDGTVYLGGTFWNVDGQPRNRIAAVNATDGGLTPWNPITTTTFYVNDIELWADTVIVGGIFADMGGAARRGIAALDPNTGLALDRRYTDQEDPINAECLLIRGDDLLAGGSFDTIFGAGISISLLGYHLDQDQAHIAWDPLVEGSLSAIDEMGNTIYFGGVITAINGLTDVFYPAVAVDTTTGIFTPDWLPDFGDICAEVLAIKATPTRVFLGAEANNLAGSQRRFFMAVAPAIITQVPETVGSTSVLQLWPNPAEDRFTLTYSAKPVTPWSATITDALGRVIQRSGPIVGDRIEFDLSAIPSGIHMVSVAQNGNTTGSLRFVLER